MPNIRLTHPELSPNAAAAAAKVSPEIRELIKRSGKKPCASTPWARRSSTPSPMA